MSWRGYASSPATDGSSYPSISSSRACFKETPILPTILSSNVIHLPYRPDDVNFSCAATAIPAKVAVLCGRRVEAASLPKGQPPRPTSPLRPGTDIALTILFPLKNLLRHTRSRRCFVGIPTACPNAKRFPVLQEVVEEQAPHLFPEAAGTPGFHLRLPACNIVVEQERQHQRKDGRQVFLAVVVLKAVALVLQGKFRSFQRARTARINYIAFSSLIGRSVAQRCFLPFGRFSPYSRKFTSRSKCVSFRGTPYRSRISFSSVNSRCSTDGGCRPRIVKPENMQVFQRLFMSGPGASRANDFVTKRRSGFGQQTRGGKKGCSRRAAECWHQPPTSSSCQSRSSVCPFRGSLKGPPRRFGPSRLSLRKDPDEGRRSPPSGCTSGSSAGRCPASAPKDENDGPVRRDGRVFYRSTEATSKTHAAGHVLPFAVPLAGKPVVLAGRRKPGPASRARTALSRSCAIARDGAEIFERLGGMTPSSSCASVDEGRQALEGEGGGHGPRGGNWRSGAPSRLTGFRFAPTGTGKRAGRPAGRSVSMTRTALA